MDKNTIIGMLLMCAVIFGFMYFQSNDENAKKPTKSTAKTEQVADNQSKNASVDSLTRDERHELDSLVAVDGKMNFSGVNLTSSEGKLAGSVTVGNTAVNIDSINNAGENQAAAIASLRDAMSEYKNSQMFRACLTGEDKTYKLKNDSIQIEISTKGAMITRATLMGYKAYHTQEDYKNNTSNPVELINGGNTAYSFIFHSNSQDFDTKNFYFEADGDVQGDSVVTMSLNHLPSGAKWGIKYTLIPGTYLVKMELSQANMDRIMPRNITDMDLVWKQKMLRQEAGKEFEDRNSALYWKLKGGDDVDHLSESKKNDEKTIQEDPIKWIAAKSQFFSTVLIADNTFNTTKFISRTFDKDKDKDYSTYLKDIEVYSNFSYDYSNSKPATFYFYIGPNRYHELAGYDKLLAKGNDKEGLYLTRLVSLGWTLFRWINAGIVMPVYNWLCSFGWSLGIVILILTILLKLVLWPLTYKSYLSQAKMKILQPDIQALNEKYPDPSDAMKKQQKTMELYKQAGANPMGGCLPMLLQMPFLIAMFWFFPSSINLRGESFLWAPDLSAPDAIISLPFSIPFLGDHLSIFCLLMTITNIAYTYVNMQSQSSSQMPGMKWMMYLMPIMFLVFFNTYAAGLSYYYFVSLLITIIQTYVTRMMVSEEKVRAVMAENAKKPKKKSGFMARLEEAQRKQLEQQKRAAKANKRR